MDARLHPSQAFGLALGDAHVIRNAGGNAKDAIRSLVISEQLLGTKAIFLVKHTGMCEADSIRYPLGAISESWEHGFWISASVVDTGTNIALPQTAECSPSRIKTSTPRSKRTSTSPPKTLISSPSKSTPPEPPPRSQLTRNSSLQKAVKDDVAFLKGHKLIPQDIKENISGWVYHVETGKVEKVV